MSEAVKTDVQELDDAVTEKTAKKKEESFPVLTWIKDDISRTCLPSIAASIEEQVLSGKLSFDLQMPVSTDGIGPKDVKIEEFTPWRISQREFICEVAVKAPLRTKPQVFEDFYFQCTVCASLDHWGAFEISEIAIYNGLWPEHLGVKLDSYGLPLFSKQDIPNAAVDIWDTWRMEALTDASQRKPEVLAGEMKLHVEKRMIHGCKDQDFILFFERDSILVDRERMPGEKKAPPPTEETFEAGTIVVNLNVPQGDDGDLAIYEACFLYHWHYIFYWVQGCKTTDKRLFRMEKPKGKEIRKNPLNYLWLLQGGMELMLPRHILGEKIEADSAKAAEKRPELGMARHQGFYYQNLALIIAADYGLKPFRAKQRLIETGRIAAKGALNWENEIRNYVPPFAVSEGYVPKSKDETFFITRRQLAKLYQEDKELRKKLMSGDYAHVDGHVCVNDPAFVRIVHRNREKTAHLTPWANAHVDECCIVFRKKYPDDGHYAIFEYIPEWNDVRLEDGRQLRSKQTTEQLEAQKKRFLSCMPTDIHEALRFLMMNNPWRRLDGYQLADESGLSLQAISSYLKDDGELPSFFDLASLCIGMNLPSWISEPLLKMIGTDLPREGAYSVWGQLFDCYCLLSVKDAMEYINNHAPRPKEDEADDGARKVIFLRQMKGA